MLHEDATAARRGAMGDSSHLQSIKYERGSLFEVLDQLKVPQELVYRSIRSVADAEDAIKTMQVRGAPLIAMVGCLGIATELSNNVPKINSTSELQDYVKESVRILTDARPTAVNMRKEGQRLVTFVQEQSLKTSDLDALKHRIIDWIEDLVKEDLETNKAIGKFGSDAIMATNGQNKAKINMLTHCNTGSLATSGYGTALGVIRALHANGNLNHAYFTETRPYNQGSRLTAFELLHDKIPSTLVCDSAVSWLMKSEVIAAVVVGADRVVKNGDTANKVGTYQLALAAKAHGVGFYVAAPFSSIDATIETGSQIVIEQRPAIEVTQIGGKPICPEGISVWNPAFDVTPAELITGIITERGVYSPKELSAILDKQ